MADSVVQNKTVIDSSDRATETYAYRSWTQQFLQALLRDKAAILGIVILVTASLVAALAPLIIPHDPTEVNLVARLAPPGTPATEGLPYVLGTDHLGRDILSRVIVGIRTSMAVGLICSLAAAGLGAALGLIAGYFRGVFGEIIMRVADMQLAFPFIVLAIVFVSLVGAKMEVLIAVLIIWSWPGFARVARADTLVVTEEEYVTAARALGVPSSAILLRHILPNILSATIVIWTFVFARLIVVESSLSFLGLGVPPPTPTLGGMLSDGRGYIDTAWWLTTFPGLAIVLIVLGANFLGDAVRDALDPLLRTS